MDSLGLSPRLASGGVALLEALFAVAIFGLVAVSLLGALRDLGQLSVETGIESAILLQMRALLEEELRDPLVELRSRSLGPDSSGVTYFVTTQPELRRNRSGQPLDGLYSILVRAEWREGTRPQFREATTLRHASLYR